MVVCIGSIIPRAIVCSWSRFCVAAIGVFVWTAAVSSVGRSYTDAAVHPPGRGRSGRSTSGRAGLSCLHGCAPYASGSASKAAMYSSSELAVMTLLCSATLASCERHVFVT